MMETKGNIDLVDRTLTTLMEKRPATHPEIRLKVSIKSSVEKFDVETKTKEFLKYYQSVVELQYRGQLLAPH